MFDFDAMRAKTVQLRDDGSDPVEITKDQRIANLIADQFGCHRAQTRELVELIYGPLPAPAGCPKASLPELGTFIHHEQCISITLNRDEDGDVRRLDAHADRGTVLGAETWRYATDAEIGEFIEKWNG